MDEGLILGAQSYRTESKNRPSNNNDQYRPAVVQWVRQDGTLGWFSRRPSEAHMVAEASPNRLKLTYPDGGPNSVFIFFVSPSVRQRNVKSWDDIYGASISVLGNVDREHDLKFAGLCGRS